MTARSRVNSPAMLALAIPVSAGALWMATSGAPQHYPLINLGALLLACTWIAFGRGPTTRTGSYTLLAALLMLMLSPLIIGPTVTSITADSVTRWIPLGPVTLHTGMVAAPAIAVLAARDKRYGAGFLLLGILAAMFQPDAATGFALTFAAVGIHDVSRNWKFGVVAILGFLASLKMVLSGEIAPQPFVEQVLIDAAGQSVFLALALGIALAIGFSLMIFTSPLPREVRFGIAGALFGFAIMAMMSHYPMPLLGYGAAPILGFGLALGLYRKPAL